MTNLLQLVCGVNVDGDMILAGDGVER